MKKLTRIIATALPLVFLAFGFSACKEKSTAGLKYTLKSDGTYEVSQGNTYNLEEIIIPSSYQGKKVTSVNARSFNNSALKRIIIPESVTSMGQSTFIGCENLQYTVKDELKYLGNKDNPYLWLMGVESDEITQATIHMLCKRIGVAVFKDCTHLTDVVMPNSVAFMGHSVFGRCTQLKNITLSKSLTSIPINTFYGCDSLTSITIPDRITSIEKSAFYSCDKLTSIKIPDCVTLIDKDAFHACDKLTSVTIGKGVTSISRNAFLFCDALTSVVFSDTSTWYMAFDEQAWQNKTGGTEIDVTDSANNANHVIDFNCYFYKL